MNAISHQPIALQNPFEQEGARIRVVDLEIYPNYFLAYFAEEDGSVHVFESHEDDDMTQIVALREYLTQPGWIQVGYNNHDYDDMILKYVLTKPLADGLIRDYLTTKKIFNLSEHLIKLKKGVRPKWYWDIWRIDAPWHRSIDIFRTYKPEMKGLKERAALMGWWRLQDLPIEPGTHLTPKEKADIKAYCHNDVAITAELFNKSVEEIKARLLLEQMYPGLELAHLHKAGVTEEIFQHVYSERTHTPLERVKKLKPPSLRVNLGECFPNIEFFTDSMREAVPMIRNIEGDASELKELMERIPKVKIGDTLYKLGIGGLHSEDRPLQLVASEDEEIIDIDVTSYYPSTQIVQGYVPRQLGESYLEILSEVLQRRVQAKREKDKVTADSLKIVINSAFGKSGNEYSFMYDPKVKVSITLTGQILLLKLAEMLTLEGFDVISGNTDGLVSRVPRARLEAFRKIYRDWEQLTGLGMEETHYGLYVRRDVNNYMAVEINPDGSRGSVKTKGVFGKYDPLASPRYVTGGRAPIIREALVGFYLEDRPVVDTIMDCKDLRMFAHHFQAKGDFVLHWGEEPQQKTVRWYASTHSKMLITKRTAVSEKFPAGRCIKVPNSENCILINDMPDHFPEDLDHKHYIEMAQDIIDDIAKRSRK